MASETYGILEEIIDLLNNIAGIADLYQASQTPPNGQIKRFNDTKKKIEKLVGKLKLSSGEMDKINTHLGNIGANQPAAQHLNALVDYLLELQKYYRKN